MRKNGGASYLGLAVIILLVIAILYVGISALQDQRVYQREAAITPTPSITPRTVRITEDPALPTSTPTPCILQKNSIGIEVKQLQQRLKDLGYYSGDVDGQYGTGTQTAVTAFQAQHGLKADGVAGEQTLAILYSESAQTFVPTPTPSATPAMLSSGSSGDEVKALQSRLQQLGFYSGVLDGDYGKGTRAAEMPGRIAPDVASARIERLIALQEKITGEVLASMRGEIVQALVEGVSRRRENQLTGKTGRNINVNFNGAPDDIGKMVRVRITGAGSNTLRGEKVEE